LNHKQNTLGILRFTFRPKSFNALWTPVFFGLRRLGAGLVIIFLLWLAVAATMLAFWQVDRIAGLLLAPYLLWVSIAGALNRSVWVRNPAV